ncbi:DNA-binding protein [Rhodococcus hoagii]|uniref:DNA-binding protein n=1 Tax=Rhodococcus hoagii TaxID=43767 RepID=A0AAE2W9D6_RHOHA|nr:DNA-binding protein [Prescottella equi]NKR79426.1 DNA-binding protein [Prescottella equi]NKR80041.1 DNA-binding protein [Prescottella equi]NKT01838.1 DNA-binding protein [Prescottella equi]NKV28182.1 DNA-binding protein [Prescottella equi]
MTDTATEAALRVIPVAEGAKRLGQTEAWYLRQLRERKLPGHKIGRKWALTEDDIRQALELTAIAATPRTVDPAGLTRTSRRRIGRRTA